LTFILVFVIIVVMSLRSKRMFGATDIFLLAEQRLRGRKAKVWRVMAQSLKTPGLVSIRDHLFTEMLDSSRKVVGAVPTNPTENFLNS